ncbi:phospholipid carrier-dependent glycosyltransferase [Kitasatospora sp. NPDC056446]|uniref:phospholipid carrier-dependent glycosyltransferase n=1 Tax=Kitasatospora sp. NPDC056446 TaxID=3345819 RepID=UPI0036810FC2
MRSPAKAVEAQPDDLDETRPRPTGTQGETDPVLRVKAWALRAATHRRFWPAVLIGGYLVQLVFRLVLVRHMSYPSVHADEDSYLVLARVLAGRPTTEMPVGVVIPGGYALLISPALRLSDDPVMAYHLIMGINAVLNALVFPLAYVALRRLGVRRMLSYGFAFAAALLPPVIFYSQFAMADTVLPVLILCWVVCMHGWLSEETTKRRYWYAAGMAASAAYSMATHDRGGVVVGLTGLAVVLALVFRWAPWRTSVVALVVLGAGFGAAKVLAAWLLKQFAVPDSTVGTQAIDGFTNPELLGRTLTRSLGQIWYLVVSTWGMAGLAIAVCLFGLFSSRIPRASRVVGAAMVALMCGVALASSAALPEDGRIDNWVYARYLSLLVPAMFVTGAAVLTRLSRRQIGYLILGAGGVTGLCYVVVTQYASWRLYKQVFIGWSLPDTSFLTANWSGLQMARATMAAFALLLVAYLFRIAAGRKGLWAVTVGLALFAGFATATITERVSYSHSDWRKFEATGFTKEAGIKPKDNLVIAWDMEWGLRMAQTYEVYQGRVWYRDPRWQEIPQEATAIVTGLPAEGKSPESYWPDRPSAWYVDKVSTKNGWILWRKH